MIIILINTVIELPFLRNTNENEYRNSHCKNIRVGRNMFHNTNT